jgi:superfamily I DNA/RNA helicase
LKNPEKELNNMPKIKNNLSKLLNSEQERAVRTIKGPLLVLAGAGTGKTRVITYRIAYMIESNIPPEHIAGMTFTNKAAREMRERLESIIDPEAARKVFLGTFHAFCARLLRREISILGYDRNFTIADDTDQNGILRQVLAELGVRKELVSPNYCRALISKVKSEMVDPKEIITGDTLVQSLFPTIHERYQRSLKNQNMVDFDDLLSLAVKILIDNPKTLEKYRDEYRHLLVDEYQDTNQLQFKLIELLGGDEANICVVGDDDQSIYGWRGAKIENILNFPEMFKNTVSIRLEQNYRSTNTILNASNSLIAKNSARHGKELWSDLGEGDIIRLVEAETDIQESAFLADAVFEQHAQGVSYSDMAILYRANHLSRQVEEALRHSRIPYRVVGSKSFYERKEVRDAIAYLKLLVNPREDQSLLRVIGAPPRGLGDKAIDYLKELKKATQMPFLELLTDPAFKSKASSKAVAGAEELDKAIKHWRSAISNGGDLTYSTQEYLKDVGYLDGLLKMYKNREEAETRRDNVLELVNAVGIYERNTGPAASIGDFLEKYCLTDDNDKVDEDESQKESVTLMTVHAAKGLEFDSVFIIGLDQNIFPNERALNEGALEEERRLLYVAITRAKKKLTMTRARKRSRYGKIDTQRPSSFLAEISKDCYEKIDVANAFKKVSAEELTKALDNFTF